METCAVPKSPEDGAACLNDENMREILILFTCSMETCAVPKSSEYGAACLVVDENMREIFFTCSMETCAVPKSSKDGAACLIDENMRELLIFFLPVAWGLVQ
jgi:hypothetical protein